MQKNQPALLVQGGLFFIVTLQGKFSVANPPARVIRLWLMLSQSQPDALLPVVQCREGDPQALADLRAQYHASLGNILRARGASPTEVDDLLADLWADC